MSLEEIKNLIKIDGSKFIIMEEGKAMLVIMTFDDYKKLIVNFKRISSKSVSKEKNEEVNEEVNRELNEANQEFNFENDKEYTEETKEKIPQSEESLRIEDLPV